MAWGAVAGAAISVVGGMVMKDSAGAAVDAQQQSTDAAVAEQRRQFDLSRADMLKQNETGRADLAHYRTAGTSAVNRLAQLMGLPNNEAAAAAVDRSKFKTGSTRQLVPGAGVNQNVPASAFSGGSLSDLIKQVKERGVVEEGEQKENVQQFVDTDTYDEQAYSDAVAEAEKAQTQSADFNALNAPISPAKKFTLADFWDDPVTKASYQQGLDQGTKALKNMAGARGGLNSGATLKALERFGIDYTGNQAAGSEGRFTRNENDIYGREVARRDTMFNRLSGISGTGQTATTNTAQLGQNNANTQAVIGANNANQISGLMAAQGNARGAAAIAGGNAMSGGIQNAGNTVANWWNRQQNQNSGNYNSSGTYQPYYTGYDSGGGPAYG